MNIVMFGPPGSGKGTYASRLFETLHLPHISTGDLVRQEIRNRTGIGKQIEDYSNRGLLVPDDMIIELLKTRISQSDCSAGFILDGFPRTVPQAKALEELVPMGIVLNLVVPDDIIIQRLSTRLTCKNCGAIFNSLFLKPKVEGICDKCGGELYTRDDDKPKVIKERLNTYRKQTQPLLEYYDKKGLVESVENNEAGTPPEKVLQRILKILEKRK